MPRSGGVYTLPAGNPVVTLTVISSAWANTTMSDIATALTGSLPTDGSAPMTGALRLVDGTIGTPGLTWGSETTSGLYRVGAADYGFSILSIKILEVTAAGLQVFSAGQGILASNATTLTASAAGVAYLTANANGLTVPAINFGSTPGTLPVNGWYLSAANTVTLNTNSIPHGSVNATGNWVIPVPVSGNPLSLNTNTNAAAITVIMVPGGGAGQFAQIATTGGNTLLLNFQQAALASWALQNNGTTNTMTLSSTGGGGQTWGPLGNVSIAAPTSGIAFTITGATASAALQIIGGASAQIGILLGTAGNSYVDIQRSGVLTGRFGSSDSIAVGGASTDFAISSPAGGLAFATGASSTLRMTISSAGGVVVNTPTSGQALIVNGGAGVFAVQINTANDAQLILNALTGGQFTTLEFANNGVNKCQIFWDNSAGSLAISTAALILPATIRIGGITQPVANVSAPFSAGVGTPVSPGLITNFPSTATLPQCAAAIGQLVNYMKNAGWLTV